MALDPNIYGFNRVLFKHYEPVFSDKKPVLLDDSGVDPPSNLDQFITKIRVGEARSECLCQGDLIRLPPSTEWAKIDDLKYIDRKVLMTLEGVEDVVSIDRGVMVEVLIP